MASEFDVDDGAFPVGNSAQSRRRYSATERNRVKLADMKAEAEYEVAKERCEDQTGAAQSACKKQAKEHEQASRAEIRKSAKS